MGVGGGSASSSATVQEFITSRNNIAHAMTADLENGRLIDRYYAEAVEEDEEFAVEFKAHVWCQPALYGFGAYAGLPSL